MIKYPIFTDGEYAKTDDLQILYDYTKVIGKSVSNAFISQGILYGLRISFSAPSSATLAAGSAIAKNGSILAFDTGDVVERWVAYRASTVYTGASNIFKSTFTGDTIWLFAMHKASVASRDTIVGSVSSAEVYDYGIFVGTEAELLAYVAKDYTTAMTNAGLVAGGYYANIGSIPTTIGGVAIGSGTTPANIILNIVYKYAVSSLTHAGGPNGPVLNGAQAILDGTIPASKINSLDGAVINPFSITGSNAIIPGTITDGMLSYGAVEARNIAIAAIVERNRARYSPVKVVLPRKILIPCTDASGIDYVYAYGPNSQVQPDITDNSLRKLTGTNIPLHHKNWLLKDAIRASSLITRRFSQTDTVNFVTNGPAVNSGAMKMPPFESRSSKTGIGNEFVDASYPSYEDCSIAPWSVGTYVDGTAPEGFPARDICSGYLKLNNKMAQLFDYPEYIEVTGRITQVKMIVGDFWQTPPIVPPDGYVIESINGELTFSDLSDTNNSGTPYVYYKSNVQNKDSISQALPTYYLTPTVTNGIKSYGDVGTSGTVATGPDIKLLGGVVWRISGLPANARTYRGNTKMNMYATVNILLRKYQYAEEHTSLERIAYYIAPNLLSWYDDLWQQTNTSTVNNASHWSKLLWKSSIYDIAFTGGNYVPVVPTEFPETNI